MPTILLVDDEPQILATIKAALQRGIPDARILTAIDAKEGLAQLDLEKVDLVCSDYKMPGMTGLDFLVAARERSPNVSRVLLTAYPDDQMAIRAINDARLDHFFVKPVRLAEVVARFQQILAEAQNRDQATLAFARSFDALRRKADDAGLAKDQARVGARRYPAPFGGELAARSDGTRADQ